MGSLLFLGTGGSLGVPVIGCDCPVCTSKKSHNQRLRPSVLLQVHHKNILIDAGPDFRAQALRIGLKHLHGVIFTHAHNDHIAGFDELRLFYFREQAPLPCLLSKATEEGIQARFHYVFNRSGPYESFLPKFDFQLLEGESGQTQFLGIPLSYTSYEQGGMPVNGFRFGNLAYVTDIRHYNPAIFEFLQNLEILIVSALRFTPTPLHFNIDEAVEFARRTGAKQVYFTHISHDLD